MKKIFRRKTIEHAFLDAISFKNIKELHEFNTKKDYLTFLRHKLIQHLIGDGMVIDKMRFDLFEEDDEKIKKTVKEIINNQTDLYQLINKLPKILEEMSAIETEESEIKQMIKKEIKVVTKIYKEQITKNALIAHIVEHKYKSLKRGIKRTTKFLKGVFTYIFGKRKKKYVEKNVKTIVELPPGEDVSPVCKKIIGENQKTIVNNEEELKKLKKENIRLEEERKRIVQDFKRKQERQEVRKLIKARNQNFVKIFIKAKKNLKKKRYSKFTEDLNELNEHIDDTATSIENFVDKIKKYDVTLYYKLMEEYIKKVSFKQIKLVINLIDSNKTQKFIKKDRITITKYRNLFTSKQAQLEKHLKKREEEKKRLKEKGKRIGEEYVAKGKRLEKEKRKTVEGRVSPKELKQRRIAEQEKRKEQEAKRRKALEDKIILAQQEKERKRLEEEKKRLEEEEKKRLEEEAAKARAEAEEEKKRLEEEAAKARAEAEVEKKRLEEQKRKRLEEEKKRLEEEEKKRLEEEAEPTAEISPPSPIEGLEGEDKKKAQEGEEAGIPTPPPIDGLHEKEKEDKARAEAEKKKRLKEKGKKKKKAPEDEARGDLFAALREFQKNKLRKAPTKDKVKKFAATGLLGALQASPMFRKVRKNQEQLPKSADDDWDDEEELSEEEELTEEEKKALEIRNERKQKEKIESARQAAIQNAMVKVKDILTNKKLFIPQISKKNLKKSSSDYIYFTISNERKTATYNIRYNLKTNNLELKVKDNYVIIEQDAKNIKHKVGRLIAQHNAAANKVANKALAFIFTKEKQNKIINAYKKEKSKQAQALKNLLKQFENDVKQVKNNLKSKDFNPEFTTNNLRMSKTDKIVYFTVKIKIPGRRNPAPFTLRYNCKTKQLELQRVGKLIPINADDTFKFTELHYKKILEAYNKAKAKAKKTKKVTKVLSQQKLIMEQMRKRRHNIRSSGEESEKIRKKAQIEREKERLEKQKKRKGLNSDFLAKFDKKLFGKKSKKGKLSDKDTTQVGKKKKSKKVSKNFAALQAKIGQQLHGAETQKKPKDKTITIDSQDMGIEEGIELGRNVPPPPGKDILKHFEEQKAQKNKKGENIPPPPEKDILDHLEEQKAQKKKKGPTISFRSKDFLLALQAQGKKLKKVRKEGKKTTTEPPKPPKKKPPL